MCYIIFVEFRATDIFPFVVSKMLHDAAKWKVQMPLNEFKPVKGFVCIGLCVSICVCTCNNYRFSGRCQFACHSRRGESFRDCQSVKGCFAHAKDECAQIRLFQTGNGMAKNK